MTPPQMTALLSRLGIREVNSGVFAGEFLSQPGGAEIVSKNPATGETIARVRTASRLARSAGAFRLISLTIPLVVLSGRAQTPGAVD